LRRPRRPARAGPRFAPGGRGWSLAGLRARRARSLPRLRLLERRRDRSPQRLLLRPSRRALAQRAHPRVLRRPPLPPPRPARSPRQRAYQRRPSPLRTRQGVRALLRPVLPLSPPNRPRGLRPARPDARSRLPQLLRALPPDARSRLPLVVVRPRALAPPGPAQARGGPLPVGARQAGGLCAGAPAVAEVSGVADRGARVPAGSAADRARPGLLRGSAVAQEDGDDRLFAGRDDAVATSRSSSPPSSPPTRRPTPRCRTPR